VMGTDGICKYLPLKFLLVLYCECVCCVRFALIN